MSSNLTIDTSMDYENYDQEQRRLTLLARRAELDAELAALPPPPSSQSSQPSYPHHRSPIHKQNQQRRSSNVPRSMSNTGASTMSRHLSSERNDMSQRPRALSQRSATSMARTNSRGNSSQRMSVPFTQNGAIPPPLNPEPRRENPAIVDWDAQEQPLTAYTLAHQAPQLLRSTSQRNSNLEQVPELDFVGETPGDFILRTMGPTAFSPSTSIPSSATLNNHRLSTGSYMQTPSTPTSDSLTTATTLTSDMSRQNSLCNGLESMQMKFPSNDSYSTDQYNEYNDQSLYDQVAHFSSSRHSRRSSDEEQSQLLVGTGGASHESQFPHSFQIPSSGSFGEKMVKSQSVGSNSSSASSLSRNVKCLQDQIAAARPLMPKGGSEGLSMSRENSLQSMARIESKDGSQDKIAISKPTYQRPKHDRVYCKLCDNHQDGFRGEHELRRHVDREHKLMVKKWICIEPTDSSPNHPVPIVPLARCKACHHQKKKYGAYYNAAAHLRRAHFNPKTKGRSKSQQKADDADKRGGKGGGDYPPMSELKYWMTEVEERVTEYLTDAQQEAAETSDDEMIEDDLFSPQTMSKMGSSNFDNTFVPDASPIINIYPATVNINNGDIYGMQDMPLDLSGAGQQTQCMDQSIYSLSSQQQSFPTFSSDPFQNDDLAFLNHPSIPSQSFENIQSFGSWN